MRAATTTSPKKRSVAIHVVAGEGWRCAWPVRGLFGSVSLGADAAGRVAHNVGMSSLRGIVGDTGGVGRRFGHLSGLGYLRR